jgi:hypothetical protein
MNPIPDDFPDPYLAEDVLAYLRWLDDEFRHEFFEIPENTNKEAKN